MKDGDVASCAENRDNGHFGVTSVKKVEAYLCYCSTESYIGPVVSVDRQCGA
jgi:hypothetical protein